MKRIMLAMFVVTLAFAFAGDVQAEKINLAHLKEMVARYPFALEVGTPGSPDHKFLYSDQQAHVHVFRIDDGELEEVWETTALGSRAAAISVSDLYGTGTQYLVIATTLGRFLIYDMNSYNLEWENIQRDFTRIADMVVENIDEDPQQEIIIVADDRIFIFDGINRNIQWVSPSTWPTTQILIGNVDDDPQPEIVMNTGRILDTRFFNIEFTADVPFGERISLFDMNGDGIPEVIGEFSDFTLRVFDVYAQREIW